MAVKTQQAKENVAYFITFTCYKWLPLIEKADAYNSFIKWFKYLNTTDVKTIGFVTMPNHFHGIIYIPENCKSTINKVVANGKRFIAYDIVKKLEQKGNEDLLSILFQSTTKSEKKSGKKHKVFKTSFDCKEIYNQKMLEKKLAYIHKNPCSGKWNLAENYTDYAYSSIHFYEKTDDNYNFVTHYKEIY